MANCFECGNLSEYDHHVIPRVRGGTKTVPLCADCHGLAHHSKMNMHHSELIKEGMKKAKLEGRMAGKPPKHDRKRIIDMRNSGCTLKEIAKIFETSEGRISEILKENKEKVFFKGYKSGKPFKNGQKLRVKD